MFNGISKNVYCKTSMFLNVYLIVRSQTLSPSAMSQIFLPVAGLMVGKVRPLTESTNSLLMKICFQIKKEKTRKG